MNFDLSIWECKNNIPSQCHKMNSWDAGKEKVYRNNFPSKQSSVLCSNTTLKALDSISILQKEKSCISGGKDNQRDSFIIGSVVSPREQTWKTDQEWIWVTCSSLVIRYWSAHISPQTPIPKSLYTSQSPSFVIPSTIVSWPNREPLLLTDIRGNNKRESFSTRGNRAKLPLLGFFPLKVWS